MDISTGDLAKIHDLAKRIAEIADSPEMVEKRAMWVRHNKLERVRPMVLVFPEGAWRELGPVVAKQCTCEGEQARGLEHALRVRLYEYEHHHDDKPVDKVWNVGKAWHSTDWGIQVEWNFSHDPLGARTFKPVITEPSDLDKLKVPQI